MKEYVKEVMDKVRKSQNGWLLVLT
jgi:hypothetical protein